MSLRVRCTGEAFRVHVNRKPDVRLRSLPPLPHHVLIPARRSGRESHAPSPSASPMGGPDGNKDRAGKGHNSWPLRPRSAPRPGRPGCCGGRRLKVGRRIGVFAREKRRCFVSTTCSPRWPLAWRFKFLTPALRADEAKAGRPRPGGRPRHVQGHGPERLGGSRPDRRPRRQQARLDVPDRPRRQGPRQRQGSPCGRPQGRRSGRGQLAGARGPERPGLPGRAGAASARFRPRPARFRRQQPTRPGGPRRPGCNASRWARKRRSASATRRASWRT